MSSPARFRRLQQALRKMSGDAILLSSPENVRYISGFTGSLGYVLVTPKNSYFFTDPRYDTQSRTQVKGFTIHIVSNQSPFLFVTQVIRDLRIQLLGVEEERLSLSMAEKLRRGPLRLKPMQSILKDLRRIKTPDEITFIRKASQISDLALSNILSWLKPGIRELEVAAELEYQMRQLGADKPAFDTIVASGHRSALPHGIASSKKIEKGDLVVIDFGANYRGYMTDMTRTFVVGKPSARQQRIFDAVREAQEKGLQKVRAGVACRDVDGAPRKYLRGHRLDRLFVHGTGHGVGLEIHEVPTVSQRSTESLKEGMVITVEPGVYVPGWGGVRIEDTVWVKRNGFESLTRSPRVMIP